MQEAIIAAEALTQRAQSSEAMPGLLTLWQPSQKQ
jgi:hypothetical protein